MEKLLFTDDSVADYLANKRASIRASLLKVQNVTDLDSPIQDRLVTDATVEPVTLNRTGAELKVHEPVGGGSNYRLTAAIPFAGDHNLLSLRAETFTMNPPRAEIVGGYTGSTRAIRFRNEVHGLPSGDEVKAWAKSVADKLEEHLALQTKQLEIHNSGIGSEVEVQIVRRRGELNAVSDLNGDLAGGI